MFVWCVCLFCCCVCFCVFVLHLKITRTSRRSERGFLVLTFYKFYVRTLAPGFCFRGVFALKDTLTDHPLIINTFSADLADC